ncbi:hydroxyisourate hydrolase [Paenibacillus arenilitoris]|uniref:5-hydroxyisourate hydrolase n=1 Tax=Paenibacillus arenilitoris TaxID=2772299 RepID=A0A927CNA9_9BACL|nr:hydroxyisourate hydrolase [Paenibacillus arenilitoris]MBD2871154.1 hydroxyisourate hydrolase [Paenibacillus arenilitoris]
MSGRITTHVLDLSVGGPAAGVAIELWFFGELGGIDAARDPLLLGTFVTNRDGRVDRPLLEGDAMKPGVYELAFAAGDYFRSGNGSRLLPELLFDRIPIRFRLRDCRSHYHVPLLVAPGGYSTYRGS